MAPTAKRLGGATGGRGAQNVFRRGHLSKLSSSAYCRRTPPRADTRALTGDAAGILKAAGGEIIREEKASSKRRAGRNELASILEFIRPGAELGLVKLDQLSR
jgi:hypothetical protein